MKILITGGAGYIGSHTAYKLIKQGHNVTIIDNLEKGHQSTLDKLKEKAGEFSFIKADLRDINSLREKLESKEFDAVIHFAAYLEVGRSTREPEVFMQNNVCGSQNLLQVLIENKISNVIFSSSAAVYGTPESTPIPEDAKKQPDSPYGESKLITERVLKTYCDFRGMNVVALRYFNPAGTFDDLEGERHIPETHLIPLLLHAYLDDSFKFSVYGDDYNTPDGSAIRDFIHMEDLVDAHIQCVQFLENNKGFHTFNVGTGHGASVLEVVKAAEKIIGKKLDYNSGPRREGDPDRLIADPTKIKTEMGWEAKYGIEEIVKSAWEWEQKRSLDDYKKI